MTSSWIASPPLIKPDESSENIHRFNPIENLLIEHASKQTVHFFKEREREDVCILGMSVYEQIASKTRNRRQKKFLNDNKLDEQTEEEEEGGEEEDDRTSLNHQVRFHQYESFISAICLASIGSPSKSKSIFDYNSRFIHFFTCRPSSAFTSFTSTS